jgi:profilin
MSDWQDYIDNGPLSLVGSGNMQQATLAGFDGHIWAVSPGWDVTIAELKVLVAGFVEPSTIMEKKITLSAVEYNVTRADHEVMRGLSASGGFAASKINTGIVVGVFMKSGNQILSASLDVCSGKVEKVADHLRTNFY